MLESLFMASCEKNSISIIERRVGQLTPEYLYTLAKLSPGERVIDTRLNVSIADVSFENPVMIAPDGTNYESSVILALQEAGFGGIEIGSVPVTQSYRSKKSSRTIDVWRGENTYRLNLYPPISINCLKNIKGSSAPVGVNLSKNSDVSNEAAPEAFAASVKKLYDNTAYFVINVGSDTAGLQSRIRAMKDADLLAKILMASQEIMEMYGKRKPFFVKITHDLTRSAVDTIIDVVQGTGSTGIIAANHTAVRVNANNEFPQAKIQTERKENDYCRFGTDMIRYIYTKTNGTMPIIGTGGITNAQTALEKIKAGASLIQIATAIHFDGLGLAGRINHGIVAEMDKLGLSHFDELIGYAINSSE